MSWNEINGCRFTEKKKKRKKRTLTYTQAKHIRIFDRIHSKRQHFSSFYNFKCDYFVCTNTYTNRARSHAIADIYGFVLCVLCHEYMKSLTTHWIFLIFVRACTTLTNMYTCEMRVQEYGWIVKFFGIHSVWTYIAARQSIHIQRVFR